MTLLLCASLLANAIAAFETIDAIVHDRDMVRHRLGAFVLAALLTPINIVWLASL